MQLLICASRQAEMKCIHSFTYYPVPGLAVNKIYSFQLKAENAPSDKKSLPLPSILETLKTCSCLILQQIIGPSGCGGVVVLMLPAFLMLPGGVVKKQLHFWKLTQTKRKILHVQFYFGIQHFFFYTTLVNIKLFLSLELLSQML